MTDARSSRSPGVRLVMVAWVAMLSSVAYGQAVLWERPLAGPGNGLGLAYAGPAVVMAARACCAPPLVERFTVDGAPVAEVRPGKALPGEGGCPPPQIVDLGRAIAAGPGGAFLAGEQRVCTFTMVVPPVCMESCTSTPWLERHQAASGLLWRSPASVQAAVAADDTGAYVVGGPPARVQKFDASGTLQWERMPATGVSGATFVAAAAVPGGGVVAAGRSDPAPLLQRFDGEGTPLWASTLVVALGASTQLEKVAVGPAGEVVAAGTRISATSGIRDIVLAKFDANGALLWTRTRSGFAPARAPIALEAVEALAVDPRGNVIVAATASTPIDYVAWTAQVDPAGQLIWSDEFTTAREARTLAAAIGIDERGQVYVGGTGVVGSGSPSSTSEAFVRKIAPSGTPLWTARRAGRMADAMAGGDGEILALFDLQANVALVRLDPGAAEGAPSPTLLLVLPPGPTAPGAPLTLAATLRGAIAPTGVVTFLVDGVEACRAVVLRPATPASSTALCALTQGLPAGVALVEVVYGGDANHGVASASARLVVAALAPAEIPGLSSHALWVLAALVALGAWSVRRSA